ncbi:phosphatase PAP2 family protein [Candidatus Saccharibacteria bacterium]|nr:phosphatase PAP2 family protein [Candidatus Saccharibacteria bacterium]
MEWEKATDIVLVASIAMLAIFFILGICQWISRKSLKKVDKRLLFAPIPLVLMVVIYFIFDKFLVLNTRPNGSGESSFPSTHVMVVATIFFIVAIILPKYIRSKVALAILDIVMLALLSIVCVGRILSDMHWLSDVIGGLAFAAIFTEIYYLCLKKIKFKKEKKDA